MEKRKLMALASSAAMVMASMGIAPAVMADSLYEELTGIDLQIIQPDHFHLDRQW